MANTDLIDRLAAEGTLSAPELEALLSTYTPADREYATSRAYKVARARFGTALHAWGVIQITNECARDCYFCGIANTAADVTRYRLTPEQILGCCEEGYRLGFRTFVLQGANDPDFTDDLTTDLIWTIRRKFPDCAITLALGERPKSSYQKFFDAGADRYLLRHETADAEHFGQLHPRRNTLANRMRCLRDLKEIGFQTGPGMLVGAPFQTPERIAKDLAFLAEFRPQVVVVGPFLPSPTAKLADHPAGSLEGTLFVLSLIRLMLPDALLPALASLTRLHPRGRELAVMSGANVLLPNLTPPDLRSHFGSCDAGRLSDEGVAAETARITKRMADLGYTFGHDRGDYRPAPAGGEAKPHRR